MRIDFYQLSRDGIERVVPLLAEKVLASGARLSVAHHDPDARTALSAALWSAEGTFLAHGMAGESHEDRQPILIGAEPTRANGATMAIFADGVWREGEDFARIMLLFGAEHTDEARALWKELSGTDGFDLHIFKQRPDGAWREGR